MLLADAGKQLPMVHADKAKGDCADIPAIGCPELRQHNCLHCDMRLVTD